MFGSCDSGSPSPDVNIVGRRFGEGKKRTGYDEIY